MNKKICKVVSILILLFFIPFFTTKVFADTNEDIDMAINNEESGLFESTIAGVLGGIAKAVFGVTTSDSVNLGFKNYDELIFNKESNSLSPFNNDTWNKTMAWYKSFTLISIVPILIGVIVTSYKFITCGGSTYKRNEAKESLLRLFFGGIAIAVAPLFIKVLLFLNAGLVSSLVSVSTGGLDSLLGNGIFTQIKTGSAIATALVICLFAYLFIKINLKFIVRKFTLIVFIVFTPIVSGLWMINRNVTAASIWFGQIIINVFMQFVYSFLFLLYMSFTAVSDGWAVSLLWAMMILPLGDTLLNMMQNLVSRVAGINNEEIANRGIGLGATMAYTVHSIGAQFKNNDKENNSTSVINKIMNKNSNSNTSQTSNSTNENKNVSNNTSKTSVQSSTNSSNYNSNNNKFDNKSKISGFSMYGVGRNLLNTGMYMAEGRNFSKNNTNVERRNYGMNARKIEQTNEIEDKNLKERAIRRNVETSNKSQD